MQVRDDVLDLIRVPFETLEPMQGNLKELSKESYLKLKKQILDTGFSMAVAAWQDGDILRVLDGHQRLLVLRAMAAEGISIPKIPVQRIVAKDENEARRKLLSLASQYGEVSGQGLYELSVNWDISPDEILDTLRFPEIDLPEWKDEFFEQPKDENEDDIPAIPKVPVSKIGDFYELGEHKLLCGDSTSQIDVDVLMGGEKADMVFTDPPYNTGMSAKKRGDSTRLNHMFDDDFSPEEWQALLSGFCSSADSAVKPDATLYVCLDWRRSHELVPHLKGRFKFSNLIVWDKVVHGLGSDYKYTHEFIHVCKKGNPKLETHAGEQEYQDVWRIQRVMGRDEEHATKKPIELVERAIRHASSRGGSVLDLFGGSGSTLIACEKTKRKCFMMEIDPAYIDVIVTRWCNLTGQTRIKRNGEEVDWVIDAS